MNFQAHETTLSHDDPASINGDVDMARTEFEKLSDKLAKLQIQLTMVITRDMMFQMNSSAAEDVLLVGHDAQPLESPCPRTKLELKSFTMEQCFQAAHNLNFPLACRKGHVGYPCECTDVQSAEEAEAALTRTRKRIAIFLGFHLD
ncbi:hypothetical protein BT96DRAFT_1015928 [Gymnopus androsaceus JB14]|uniref:Uncharacterized protein n=1 Tax=Gymnopus androsaceus JB14 TaxID=1447944 RepID=A0A6A4I882_9AGAR|nr:hypothetical protein BT96DRAFT_1015928 [Gymnopus androsaceus JB14]